MTGRLASRRPGRRTLMLAAWAGSGLAWALAGALVARHLYTLAVAEGRLPLWDMAKNGWQGLELALDLAAGRPLELLLDLNAHETWPFGYSLLLVPFFLAGGPTIAAATAAHCAFFALVPAAMVLAAREVDAGPVGWWGGALASLLWLASPLARLHATLLMREVPGALLTLLAAASLLAACRRGTLAAWRIAGLGALALFFVKYNYGISWLLAVAVFAGAEVGRGRRRELARVAAPWVLPWRSGPWWRRALAAAGWLIAGAWVTGASVGGVVYGLLVLATVVLAARWRRAGRRLAAGVRALPPPLRAGVETLVVPIWLWSLSPDPIHPRGVLDFLRNRTSGLPPGEAILFYPRVFLHDVAPSSGIGVATLALAVLAALGWRRGRGWRLLAVAAAVAVALAALHPYKQDRFVLHAAPLVMLLAGLAAAWVLHAPWPGRWRLPAGGLLAAAVVGAGIWAAAERAPALDERWLAEHRNQTAAPELAAALETLRERAQPGARVAVLGTSVELSPALVEWWWSGAGGGRAELVEAPSRFAVDAPPELVRRRLDRWLEKRRPRQVLAIEPLPGSPWAASADYRAYNAWQSRLVPALAESSAWREEPPSELPDLDLRVRSFSLAE